MGLTCVKEQITWGNLKYLGGYPNKIKHFICGLYKEGDKIEFRGGVIWQVQFLIKREYIIDFRINSNYILMEIIYNYAEIELLFTASNIKCAYNKMITAVY